MIANLFYATNLGDAKCFETLAKKEYYPPHVKKNLIQFFDSEERAASEVVQKQIERVDSILARIIQSNRN